MRRVWVLRGALGLSFVAALAYLGLAPSPRLDVIAATAIGLWIAERWGERRVIAAGLTAASAAFSVGDASTQLAILRELEEATRENRVFAIWIQLDIAAGLSANEQYREAQEILERLMLRAEVTNHIEVVQNNLAWCLAHLGQTERALSLSRLAIATAETKKSAFLGACRGTYACCLVLAGMPNDAVAQLNQVLHDHASDSPAMKSIRLFYLGEALSQLSRVEDARVAYQRAANEAPTSRWSLRARQRLQEPGF